MMNLKELPADERKKIATLISEDKKQNDTDWMYNQKQDDTEAYLLGKSVAKAEQVQKLGLDYDESSSQRIARIDMESKFREDPLTIMRQREAEKRAELLRNSAKVKKLRRLLTVQKLQKEQKRKKKRMKERRRRSRSRSSTSSDSSSGDELLEKFMMIVQKSDEKESHSPKNDRSPNHNRNHYQEDKVRRDLNKTAHANTSHRRERERPTFSQEETSVKSTHHSKLDERKRYPDKTTHATTFHRKDRERPKLSQEELDARRAQMMADAKTYEQSRSSRTTHHYHERQKESERDQEERNMHGAAFISQMKNDHTQRSTIEEGIHRKANSRQRGEMNNNFFRR